MKAFECGSRNKCRDRWSDTITKTVKE